MASIPPTDRVPQRDAAASAEFATRVSVGPSDRHQQHRPASYLSPSQQDLLLAALNSQASGNGSSITIGGDNKTINPSTSEPPSDQVNAMNSSTGSGLFMSPRHAELDSFDTEYTPDLDYFDGDNFDFDNADLGGEMIGALPGSAASTNGAEQHEKRKNSEDDIEEGDAKRQELQESEKSAKKPGRKPLTSEPTTKRKAQNRAAQRAFRERKEKHLKDLETKVAELEKSDEANKHEIGLLKAQVDRKNIELREYRKRLSMNGTSNSRSPPVTANGSTNRSNSNPSLGGNFQFDFPKFGGLPGSQMFGNQTFSNGLDSGVTNRQSATPPSTRSPTGSGSFSGPSQTFSLGQREGSVGSQTASTVGSTMRSPGQAADFNTAFTSYSSQTNMHGFADTLPQMNTASNDPFGDLFSPGLLKSASVDNTGNYFGSSANTNGALNPRNEKDIHGGDSNAGLNRVFQFNSGSSASDSASPSASSSNWNVRANSSCETSPEPSHGSPGSKDKNVETFGGANSSATVSQLQSPTTNFANNQFNLEDFNVPSTDSFDPVLFGGYRDTVDPLVGGGDFTGGFFDDALNSAPYDLGSPSNLFGILQSPEQTNKALDVTAGVAHGPTPSQNLMEEVNKTQNGYDDIAIATAQPKKTDGRGKLISCNNIWSQLQSHPDYQDGKFDLDNLCSELRTKARCSESGVLVDQQHVDAALRKLGKKDSRNQDAKPNEGSHSLMFEEESWDNVLKKLGGKRA